MPTPKFYPFPAASHEQWLDQIRKDLKGKVDETSLKSSLWEEIQIEPIYSFEQMPAGSEPNRFNPASKLPGLAPRIWHNLVSQSVKDEKSTNAEILEVLQMGAEGLILQLDGTEDLNLILKGVITEYVQLYFLPLADVKPVLNQVKNWVASQQLIPGMLNGGILWSPTDELFRGKSDLEEQISLASGLLSDYKEFPDFYPITINFARYANAGGTGIQELTFGLGELIEILDQFVKRGIPVNQAIGQIAFHTAVGINHFPEIAKMKALRSLLVDLISNLGGDLELETIHILASTSQWNKSFLDPNTSLIRQTYEAMAAVLGGCNSLWVRPIADQDADNLSKRISRNVSTILREESFLDKLMDPAAGSYFLESIQNELEDKVLKHLEKLEEDGGWTVNFLNRSIHKAIRNSASIEQEAVLAKQKIVVGVNSYELKNENFQKVGLGSLDVEDYQLPESRASYLVEIEKSQLA